jgi:SPP1 family predicted phage head-tail adaptor
MGQTDMQIGKLRHRVELKSLSQNQNNFGETQDTWTTYTTVWARIEPLRGRELMLAQQANSEVTIRVTIRYNSSVTTKDRVVIGSRVLEIVAVINLDERNIKQELLCKEIE